MIISDRLKAFTTSSHQKLEKSVVGLIHSLKNFQDYSHLLSLFYSYLGGLELLIESIDISGYLPDFNERRKVKLILEDLCALDGPIPETCQKTQLPFIENPFRALGALYVMEGSTLGGVYIIKMLQKKLSGNENIYHFFSGYGDRNPSMWNRFKNALDNATVREEDVTLVLSGAEDTFQKFYEWINTHQNVSS